MSWHYTKNAVITGAGSGIGRALALELTGHGFKVGISDIDTEGAQQTLDMVQRAGGSGEISDVMFATLATINRWQTTSLKHGRMWDCLSSMPELWLLVSLKRYHWRSGKKLLTQIYGAQFTGAELFFRE